MDDLTEKARKLDEKLASQIGDDVSVIFSHEYLFKEARRVTAALLARLEAAEAKLARMEEALIWCSGSQDFQEGGYAREGWLKLCAPLVWGREDGNDTRG